MSEPSIFDRVAEKLALNPQQAAMWCQEWEQTPKAGVVRTALVLKLEDHMAETTRKLRTCSTEELKGLQGTLTALELAITTVSSRIV